MLQSLYPHGPLEQFGHGRMRHDPVSRHGHLWQQGIEPFPDVLHCLGEHCCRRAGQGVLDKDLRQGRHRRIILRLLSLSWNRNASLRKHLGGELRMLDHQDEFPPDSYVDLPGFALQN